MACIAVDTCVFIHLLNPQNNPGSHIDKLLTYLMEKRYDLVVDSTSKIPNEYQVQIIPMLRDRDDTGTQLVILRYWMSLAGRQVEDVDSRDQLMRAIRGVIHEADEHADRAFVYVACKADCYLVTNDGQHILPRRKRLLSATRKLRGLGTDLICSMEAYDRLMDGAGSA